MLKITSLSILLLSLSFITYGQKPRIKEVIAITIDYHHTPNPVSVDTLITKYDTNGAITNLTDDQKADERYQDEWFPKLDSTVIIDTAKNYIHSREYYVNGRKDDLFITTYKDSSVTYTSMKDPFHKRAIEDSIFKQVDYLKGNKVVKSTFYVRDSMQFYKLSSEFKTKQDNIFYKVWEENQGYSTYRYRYNKITKTQRQYSFNSLLKEWYMSRKEKFNSKGRTKKLVTQFYHDYFKRYFKEFTYYCYNNYGKETLVITRDYDRSIEKKEVYLYTYY